MFPCQDSSQAISLALELVLREVGAISQAKKAQV